MTVNFKIPDRMLPHSYQVCSFVIYTKPFVHLQKALLIYTDTHLSCPVQCIKSCPSTSNVLSNFFLLSASDFVYFCGHSFLQHVRGQTLLLAR